MKKILAIMLCILAICANAISESDEKYDYKSNPQYQAYISMFELNDRSAEIVFVGDSIFARCNFDEFFPDRKVLNRGIGSDVTEGVYNRVDEIITHNPQYIFIMIGINDIGKGIPIEDSIDFYRKTIIAIQMELPESKLFVLSLLPTTTCLPEVIESYNEHLIVLANEMDVVYVPIYENFIENGRVNQTLLSADGVHLNGAGYTVMIQTLMRYLD